LEDRTTPIVGQYLDVAYPYVAGRADNEFLAAPKVAPHGGYDGVVRFDLGGGPLASGSLFSLATGQSWGHHIITAAHVFKDPLGGLPPDKVQFEMFRYGSTGTISKTVPIQIPIQSGPDYQIIHPSYSTTTLANDIAVLRLADPVGTPSPSRLLIAPANAEQYSLYPTVARVGIDAPNELGQQVTVVGYGYSGDGEQGGDPAAKGRFFTELGVKRRGINQIDQLDPTDTQLRFDFDSGLAANDTLGNTFGPADYGIPGIPAGTMVPGPTYPGPNVALGSAKPVDIGTAPGDSGGPFFINGLIAAVVSRGDTAIQADTKWGDVTVGTRVAAYRSWIDSVATQGPGGTSAYDVVLDMQYQVYGQAGTPGENLTITAKNEGGYLELFVTGPDAKWDTDSRYNGLYYKAPANNIKSLTLRGTDDNETFQIVGDLGIQGNVYISGGTGSDKVELDYSQTPGDGNQYTVGASPESGWDMRLNRATTTGAGGTLQTKAAIDTKDIETYTLSTGTGGDIVRIEKASSALTGGLFVKANGGVNQQVIVGAEGTSGMASVQASVFINAGGDWSTELVYEDAEATADGSHYTLGSPADPAWDSQLSRTANNGATPLQPVLSWGVDKHTLKTGAGADVVQIDRVSGGAARGVFVYTNAGDDTIQVGSLADGLQYISNAVSVDGGATGTTGGATLTYEDTKSPTAGNQYTLGAAPTPWDMRLNRAVNGSLMTAIDARAVDKYVLNTSMSADVIQVDKATASAVTRGVWITANDGNDQITVGSVADGLNPILAPVAVTGGNGLDGLIIDDRASPTGQTYNVRGNSVEKVNGPTISNVDNVLRTIRGAANPGGGGNNVFLYANAAGGESDLTVEAGPGADTVTVASSAATDLAGPITLDGQAGYDQLEVTSGGVYDPNVTGFERLDLLDGVLTFETHPLAVDDMTMSGGTLDGSADVTATATLAWTGGTMQGAGQTVADSSSTLTVSGADPKTLDTRRLANYGTGTWSADIAGGTGTLANSGTLYPGQQGVVGSPSLLGSFDSSGALEFDLGGSANPSDTISAQAVSLSGSFDAVPYGDFPTASYTIINNTGTNPVAGTFLDLPEGAVLTIAGVQFRISYVGGDGNDVVLTALASIGDRVWDDSNADGIQDGDEYGLSGVTVSLYDAASQLIAMTTTDANGSYSFTGLGAGTYQVAFAAPTGYSFSPRDATSDDLDSDADPTTGRTVSFTLAAGESQSDVDAGLHGSGGSGGSIGDYVWDDADMDGVQEAGEYGLSGVPVSLYDGNGTLLASTTTDPYGYYSFGGLGAGTYQVEFAAPYGYSFSPRDATTDDLDSDADPSTGLTATLTLAPNEQRTDLDAGLYSSGSGGSGGFIGDYVWDDADQDGIQGAGEYGLSGVTVNLLDGSGNLVASATTDPSGYYSFAGLAAGTYQVEFVAPYGYLFSPEDATADTSDSDADPTTGRTAALTLAAGESRSDVDAGLYSSGGSGGSGGAIGDYVWYDGDQDGVQDAGESGFSGATVNLRDGSGNLLASTTSDASGFYSFAGLGAGTYQVEFVAPAGYVLTTPESQTVTLAPNETRSDLDAGLYSSGGSGGSGGFIGDAVWYDSDADGVQDAGEYGFGGATVNLRDSSGNLLASTTSDSYGYYSFGGLGAGTYQVEFVAPSGYSLTTPGTQTVTLAANETRSDIDAGVYGSGGSGGSGGVMGTALWRDPETSSTPGTAGAEARPDSSAGRAATPNTTAAVDAPPIAEAGRPEDPAELSWSGVYVGDSAWAGPEKDPLLAWQ
jgi:hypothetical protein